VIMQIHYNTHTITCKHISLRRVGNDTTYIIITMKYLVLTRAIGDRMSATAAISKVVSIHFFIFLPWYTQKDP